MVLHGWTPTAPAVEKNKDATTTNGAASTSSSSKSASNDMSDDDDLTILEPGVETIPTGKKRKLSDLSETPIPTDDKRAKKIPEKPEDDGDVVVMLEDGNDNKISR